MVEAVFNVSVPTSNRKRALSLGVSAQGDVTPSGVNGPVHDVLQLKAYWAEEQLCFVCESYYCYFPLCSVWLALCINST